MRVDRARLAFLWRRGGNWLVFLLAWVVSAAIIGAIENTVEDQKLTEEARLAKETQGIVAVLKDVKGEIEGSEGQDHIDELVKLISRKEFPRVWELGEDKFDDHVEVLEITLKLMREEFQRVVDSRLEDSDSEGKEIANKLITLLSDENTLGLLETITKKERAAAMAAANATKDEEETWETWHFGSSLHFVSTVFTTIGYGAKYPETTGGKFITILMVLILIPFFIHCLCTSATGINSLIDRVLGLAEHYDDLEDLTAEKTDDNIRLRKEAMWKGSLVLLGVLAVHMIISSIYHLVTTGWGYGDVLYFEFVNYSTIGFGDMVPQDDLTVAGAIFKNLLVKIPAAVLLLCLFLRLLPAIS